MPPTASRHPRVRFAAALLAVVSIASACGHSSPRGPTGQVTIPSSRASAVAPRPTPESEVAAAYVAAMQAATRLYLAPNPDDPSLAATRSGQMLEAERRRMRDLQAHHIVLRLRQGRWPTVRVLQVGIHGERALVRTCVIDDTIQMAMPSARVVNDNVSSRLYQGVLARTSTWKLAEQHLLKQWGGLGGCVG